MFKDDVPVMYLLVIVFGWVVRIIAKSVLAQTRYDFGQNTRSRCSKRKLSNNAPIVTIFLASIQLRSTMCFLNVDVNYDFKNAGNHALEETRISF